MIYVVSFLLVLVLALEARAKDEPLAPLKPWTKLCKMHTWKGVILLNKSQYDDYLKEPNKYAETTYCDVCGYVPSLEMHMKAHYRDAIKQRETADLVARQRMKDIEEAKEEFFQGAVKDLPATRHYDLRVGYDLYNGFLEYLPEMVKQKELARLLKTLGAKDMAKAGASNVTYLKDSRLN